MWGSAIWIRQNLSSSFTFPWRHFSKFRYIRLFDAWLCVPGSTPCFEDLQMMLSPHPQSRTVLPAVTIDMVGSSFDADSFQNCLELVQTYVLSHGDNHQSFFTFQIMDLVRGGYGQCQYVLRWHLAFPLGPICVMSNGRRLWPHIEIYTERSWLSDVGVARIFTWSATKLTGDYRAAKFQWWPRWKTFLVCARRRRREVLWLLL